MMTAIAPPAARSAAALGGIWTLQVLLSLAFLAHGWMFLAPPPEIAPLMNAMLPRWFQLFLGVAEVLGGIGIVLPSLTGVQRWLTTWAAGGLMLVTASATILHAARGETSSALITLVLLAMAATVAVARRRG